MRIASRHGPEPELVAAAITGDARALDLLVAESLPLVYNIVGLVLSGQSDVDAVVQETMLRILRGLDGLNDPGSYRSWMVAIAIRQVRDNAQDRKASTRRDSAPDDAGAVADPTSDFAAVTILRLGLTDQRRDVAEATRWLTDDRELLSLWWLEEAGELDRPALARALGMTEPHAAVRVQRMTEQLDAARRIVRALHANPRCPGLDESTLGWDGIPGRLWRRRLAGHIGECGYCDGRTANLFPVDVLIASLPLVPLPASLVSARIPFEPSHVFAPHATVAQSVTRPDQGTVHGHAAAKSAEARRKGRHRWGFGGRGATLIPVIAAAAAVVIAVVGVRMVSGTSGTLPSSSTVASKPTTSLSTLRTLPGPGLVPAIPSSSGTPSRTAAHTTSPTAPTSSATVVAPPAPTKVTGPKKGVGARPFSGVDQALAQSGAGWYYTWSTTHGGINGAPGVSFVPMIWGPGNVTASQLAQAKSQGPFLLGFNEPDMSSQSNMTVAQALNLWPQLMATGLTLGSPAVAYDGDTPGGWLDQFMTGAKAKGYRVDFITLHWYGSDFKTPDAVAQLQSYIQRVHDRYHLPIWLTEYALIKFSNPVVFPTQDQEAAFVTASIHMLDSLPFVQRFAWYRLRASDTGPSSGLFGSGPVANQAALAFEAAS